LQLLSAARLTLGSGRVLNFEKFYVAATSNIGSPLLVGSKTNVRETLVRRVIQEARDQMRPEIFDRFDRVLVFNRLSYEVQIEVGRLHLQWEMEAQERRGHRVTECDAEALKAIVRNGYSEKQGARRMRNAAREAVQEAVREALLSGRETSGRLEYNGHSKSFFING
jgi:ATP-dependent Clp protease ATP-binding subunit ClpA